MIRLLTRLSCAADSTVAGGNVPDAWVTQQLAVMNAQAKYGQTDFRFQLADTDRVNASWFDLEVLDPPGRAEIDMKTSLRKGGKVVTLQRSCESATKDSFESGAASGCALWGATEPGSISAGSCRGGWHWSVDARSCPGRQAAPARRALCNAAAGQILRPAWIPVAAKPFRFKQALTLTVCLA